MTSLAKGSRRVRRILRIFPAPASPQRECLHPPRFGNRTIQSDYVPSTGEYRTCTHFLFYLQDGSFIAFSDHSNDEAARPSPNTPLWVKHLLFRIDSVADLEATKQRQQAGGIDVIGVTDHHTFKSIYFCDPPTCGSN